MRKMSTSRAHRLFLALLVCISSLLCSCSSIQLGYNQADFLIKWWIDDYIDLSSDQVRFYDQAFPAVAKKHRQEELPKALQKLRILRSKLDQPLMIDDGVMLVKDIQSFSRNSVNLLLEDASTLAFMLKANQMVHMENAFVKSNKKYQSDYLKGTTDEQFDKRVEKIIERAESIGGSLNKAQKTQIRDIAKEHLMDMSMAYQTRLFKQQLILKTLKQITQDQPTPAQVKNILSQLLDDLEFGSTKEQKEFESNRMINSGILIAKITQVFDDQQRKKSQVKIHNWEKDLQILIPQPSKS